MESGLHPGHNNIITTSLLVKLSPNHTIIMQAITTLCIYYGNRFCYIMMLTIWYYNETGKSKDKQGNTGIAEETS